jgi:low affinity Fe/Cu permease
MPKKVSFGSVADSVTHAAGSNAAILAAFGFVLGWAISGPFFHFSNGWQVFINTTTSLITFLMVFLIQKSQNKDSLAIQLKLNELVAAHEFASNRLVNVEDMTEEELKVIRKYYHKLGEFAKSEENLQQTHSIDEVHEMHEIKKEMEEELNKTVDH